MRILARSIAMTVLFATYVTAQPPEYQQVRILSIQPRGARANVHKLTDAPPPSSEADYDIGVQIGDMDYVGRYRHASEYVPGNWEVGKTVQGRVGKHRHRIYLKDMTGNEVAMPILSRQPAPSAHH